MRWDEDTGAYGLLTASARRAARLVAVLATLLAGLLGTMQVSALPLPAGEAELRCWQRSTRERTQVNVREPTAVEFANLRDGDVVRSPLQVEFAVRGMGVMPAGLPNPAAGHHHILVDRPLPSNIGEPIPFDDGHRHFGKAQTSTLLELKPGRHTLRLLFADHAHKPYFVYSREIAINVSGPRDSTPAPVIDAARSEASCAAWYQEERSRPRPANEPLYVANVRAGESLTSPFTLRFGALKHGICAGPSCPDGTGHFAVEVLDALTRRVVQAHDLDKGTTQMNLFLLNGEYIVRLRLLDKRGVPLVPPHELPLRVGTQQAL